MANEQNLIPQAHKLTVEEQSKGGKASAAARRERKALKETLEVLMSMPIKDGKLVDIEKIKSLSALKGKNISVQEAILLKALQEALKGNMKALKLVIELMDGINNEDYGNETDGFVESIEEAAKLAWQCE